MKKSTPFSDEVSYLLTFFFIILKIRSIFYDVISFLLSVHNGVHMNCWQYYTEIVVEYFWVVTEKIATTLQNA